MAHYPRQTHTRRIAIDALTFVQRYTRTPWQKFFFGFIFLLPIWGNALSRLAKHGWWLNDFDALVCGSASLAKGLSPYGLHPVCEGLRPAPYVYAPQVGQAFAPVLNLFSLTDVRLAYLVILLPTMAGLLWFALVKALPNAPWQFRLMTLSAMAGSALACGNIGLVLHGLVILAAMNIKKSRIPFIAIVALSALIKPVMLTYLIVLLYEDRPLLARVRSLLIAACIGLSGFIALMLSAGPFSEAWHQSLNAVVIQQQPGIGYFSYTSLIGLGTASRVTLAGLALFMIVIALSGLVLAEWGKVTASERIFIGLGIAQLLNPRLMDYDMLALAPFMATVVMLARPLGARVFTWVSWVFAGTLIGCVVINIAEIELIHRAPVTVFIYCGLTMFVAGKIAWPHSERIKGWLRNPLPVLQDLLAQRI